MKLTPLDPDFTAASQITAADVEEIVRLGYRSVVCNRPDGEAPDQTDAETIRLEAERQGLAFAFLPVISGYILPEDVAAFRSAMPALPRPVLLYCRSGSRCQHLWLLAQH